MFDAEPEVLCGQRSLYLIGQIFLSKNCQFYVCYIADVESYAVTQRLLAKDDHFIFEAFRQLINILFNRLV